MRPRSRSLGFATALTVCGAAVACSSVLGLGDFTDQPADGGAATGGSAGASGTGGASGSGGSAGIDGSAGSGVSVQGVS